MSSRAASPRATQLVLAVADNSGAGPASGDGPNRFVPKPRFDYKAPSILAEHKYLAIVFLLLIIATSIYLYRAPHKPLKIEPAATPVYVEPIR
jgi:hypothetical protein